MNFLQHVMLTMHLQSSTTARRRAAKNIAKPHLSSELTGFFTVILTKVHRSY